MQNQGLQGYDNWVFEGVCEVFKLLFLYSVFHFVDCKSFGLILRLLWAINIKNVLSSELF